RAEASTGDTRGTSGGACHGRIGLSRSTPACDSHDLADETSRAGTCQPWLRASSPTMPLPSSDGHGSASCSRLNSVSAGKYKNDGCVGRGSTEPGATSCAIANISIFGNSDDESTPG